MTTRTGLYRTMLIVALAWGGFAGAGHAQQQWDDLVTYEDVANKPYKYGHPSWTAGKTPTLGVRVDAQNGNGASGTVWIPLNEFARASAVNKQESANAKQIAKNTRQIAANTAAIEANTREVEDLNDKVDDLDDKNDSNVAAMGAIDFQRPLPGKSTRLALGAGAAGDKAALGLSLSVVKSAMDISLGVGSAEDASVAKGSIGFSFF